MTSVEEVVVLAFGLVIGSFLNVVIYRLPRGQSIVWPRSRCTNCGTSLGPLELVPILSYVFLRGKCRHCGEAISWRYPLGELVTAMGFLALYRRFGPTPQFGLGLILVSALIVASGIDLEFRRIPNVIVAPLAGLGVVSAAVIDGGSALESIFGAALGASLFGAVAALSRGGIGMGDVKLLAAIGAWVGWRGVIMTAALSSILASIVGLTLMIAGVIDRRHPLPFGPFLSLVGVVVHLYEERLLELWLG